MRRVNEKEEEEEEEEEEIVERARAEIDPEDAHRQVLRAGHHRTRGLRELLICSPYGGGGGGGVLMVEMVVVEKERVKIEKVESSRKRRKRRFSREIANAFGQHLVA
ncbi:hypothetical protein V1478_009846 [Vespula squamosa]|uniref:Uncharacterized protein n=1 Tax=Vespula squamosa TaxID=30214 RepID=A0ABD2AMB3_VESSQ